MTYCGIKKKFLITFVRLFKAEESDMKKLYFQGIFIDHSMLSELVERKETDCGCGKGKEDR